VILSCILITKNEHITGIQLYELMCFSITVPISHQTCRVLLTVLHFVMEEKRSGISCGIST